MQVRTGTLSKGTSAFLQMSGWYGAVSVLPGSFSVVKSRLLQSFCTSFYGGALWRLACPELQLLETKYYGEFGTFHTVAIEG